MRQQILPTFLDIVGQYSGLKNCEERVFTRFLARTHEDCTLITDSLSFCEVSAGARTLLLGEAASLSGITPETHVLAGPWCLSGCTAEEKKDDWGYAFDMPPEPLAEAETLDMAARQARQLATDLAPLFQAHLNTLYNVHHDAQYWDFVLAPWLGRVVEVLTDRLYRTEGLVRCFGEQELHVPVLPETSTCAFADTQDFIMGGMLSPTWNHWLFSRLLERDWPVAWKKRQLAPLHRSAQAPAREHLLKRFARNLLFGLPFPRIKGFNTGQSLRLSLTLFLNRNTCDDTIPLQELNDAAWCSRIPQERPAPLPLPLGMTVDEAFALALALLPESLRTARIPARLTGTPLVRTRVVSVAACEDDAYRIRMAQHRGKGCRMVFIQHGGEYGFVRTSVAYPLVEYRQHRFITWGWSRHGDMPGHFLPLPHPQLAQLAQLAALHRPATAVPTADSGQHHETASRLLLVGTEMALLPYTLKSMLRGRQFFAYRQDKARFLDALGDLRSQTLYRPYFDVPSSLEDAPWILRRFPDVTRCTGSLEPHLLGCRLLVLDHAGTTLAQALAANTPFLLYWNPELVHFAPEVLPLLDGLRAVGILHDSPEAAATHALAIWDAIPAWWNTTREARKRWADQHALVVDGDEKDVMALWSTALKQL